MNIEIIDKNLKDCWEYYKDYLEKFRKTHYSDAIHKDFIEWCEEELYQCPNCGMVVIKDEQMRLYDDYNCDNVCDDCIEEGGYYD